MTFTTDVDLTTLEPLLESYRGKGRTMLLPALHEAQSLHGYLPEPVLRAISETLHVPLADVHGVVEFYSLYYSQPVGKRMIRICTDPACLIAGGEESLQAACQRAEISQAGGMSADGAVTVERATCLGLCDQAPGALVNQMAVGKVSASSVGRLFDLSAPTAELQIRGEPRILTRNIHSLNALDLPAQRKEGAFGALEKAIKTMRPDELIEAVKESGLVGRGGAAFPTGLKWEATRKAEGEIKYVVCNADESEPGTFKDRLLMEGDPFRLLEGMALCGYAIGARKGYVFVRGEYPQAAEILEKALGIATQAGLLGEHILGSTFSFEIELRRGGGAYICGEETALFEAIEGKRGFPRVKPPFPTTHGLFNQPTTINNVETLIAIPDIVQNGGAWFKQWGTEKSSGTKLFCVSGHVKSAGVVEVPYGITLREIIEKHCGGFEGTPRAILMGGAAGTFITPEQIDVRLSFEDLRTIGAPLGSGVIMVFNETVDLREVLHSLARFFAHESCGKCYPCQLGTQRQMEIIARMVEGKPRAGDFELLQDVGWTMTDASLCGLGQTAASAVLSAMKLWPEMFH